MQSRSPFRRRPRLRAGVVGLLAAGTLAAAAGAVVPAPAAAAPIDAAAVYAPSRVPDRITLTPTADPSTSQYVTWRTSTGVAEPVVELREASSLTYRNDNTTFAAERSTEMTTDLGYKQTFHRAQLTGLKADTMYQYRVGDRTNFSEWQHFTTEAATAEPFSFLYLGDVQTGIKSQASRVVRNAFRDRPDADLVLQIGDLVDDAMSDQQWGEVYEATDYVLGTKNVLITPGNHEYEGETLSPELQAQFTFPDNGPQGEGLDGTVHYTDYQGVRFVSLNSNRSEAEPLAIQTAWLERVLEENPNKWTVVYFHHPLFSLDEGRGNRALRQSWLPLLEKHDVDLVLQGHDHGYGRGNTDAAEEGNPASWDKERNYSGPVYTVSVVGDKQYRGGPRVWNENGAHLRRMGGGVQLYQLIDVAGDQLRYEARTADGQYYDGFTIVKNEHGKAVTDDEAPDEIDPTDPGPCLGCENPEEPEEPEEPGEPVGDLDYAFEKSLVSVDDVTAQLPAGVVFSQERDTLFLGDQNSRSIWEIDPVTDEVLGSMTLPENIRDLGIDDENELLYVGQQNKNWLVVSIAAGSFGEVVRGPFPISESNRSLDVDPVLGYVYAAIPARGVEVFDAVTGESKGTINGTTGAYYVAADEVGGHVAVAYFEELTDVKNVEVFDAGEGFRHVWDAPTRANARQVDFDSTNGLVYVGFTGVTATSGGFSVYGAGSGELLVDKAGPEFGKDGYGIAVDEERQRVYVSNRDHRLNPPGEETAPVAVTVSRRILPEQLDYRPRGQLVSVDDVTAQLPAGVVFSQERDTLFLGDQNSRSIWEIDPVTDEVLGSMTLPENIRDLGIDDENELLYVGQQNKNWLVVSIAAGSFGEVVRGPFPISESNRSLDVDPKLGYVYAAIPARGVEVFDAVTGESKGTINGTTGAYYVAADEVGGHVAVAYFEELTDVKNVEVFDAGEGFRHVWDAPTRANARQVDFDSTNGLVYVGFTGVTATSGGFSVYGAGSGELLVDKAGPEFGKDGYGIAVDEERQRVYVSNRDHRLNPPGEETAPVAVTISERILEGGNPDPDPEPEPEPEVPGGTAYTPTPMAAIPDASDAETDDRPVGSVVEQSTGHLYVANEMRPARIRVIDPAADTTLRTITVPNAADEGVRDVALDEERDELYVAYSNQWVVLDQTSGAVLRGPFAFDANVRGIDVDVERGRVLGATRGAGFYVGDATTGALVQKVEIPGDNWSSHGIAYDAVHDRVYLSNENGAGTVGLRVLDGATYDLLDDVETAAPSWRSVAVDPVAGRVYLGHAATTFDASGVTVLRTEDLSQVARLAAHAFGNKVYGVSVDTRHGRVYVSARDRYPTGLVKLQRGA